jgi:hypothetical protein
MDRPFHPAFLAHDLHAARALYGRILGGREGCSSDLLDQLRLLRASDRRARRRDGAAPPSARAAQERAFRVARLAARHRAENDQRLPTGRHGLRERRVGCIV